MSRHSVLQAMTGAVVLLAMAGMRCGGGVSSHGCGCSGAMSWIAQGHGHGPEPCTAPCGDDHPFAVEVTGAAWLAEDDGGTGTGGHAVRSSRNAPGDPIGSTPRTLVPPTDGDRGPPVSLVVARHVVRLI